jgi:hypothetical protein
VLLKTAGSPAVSTTPPADFSVYPADLQRLMQQLLRVSATLDMPLRPLSTLSRRSFFYSSGTVFCRTLRQDESLVSPWEKHRHDRQQPAEGYSVASSGVRTGRVSKALSQTIWQLPLPHNNGP